MSIGLCPTGEHYDDWCCKVHDHGIEDALCVCDELRENAEDFARALKTAFSPRRIKPSGSNGDT